MIYANGDCAAGRSGFVLRFRVSEQDRQAVRLLQGEWRNWTVRVGRARLASCFGASLRSGLTPVVVWSRGPFSGDAALTSVVSRA